MGCELIVYETINILDGILLWKIGCLSLHNTGALWSSPVSIRNLIIKGRNVKMMGLVKPQERSILVLGTMESVWTEIVSICLGVFMSFISGFRVKVVAMSDLRLVRFLYQVAVDDDPIVEVDHIGKHVLQSPIGQLL